MRKLIIDGNAVYELDENCMLKKNFQKNKTRRKKNLQNKKKQEQTHNIKYYLCNLDKKMMMLS